jgi:hypothetical protein
MTATVTYSFKSNLLQSLKTNVLDGQDNYYLAIGRSDVWNATDTPPVTSDSDIAAFSFVQTTRHSLMSYKRVFGASLVIPRVNWTSGTTYYAYSDQLSEINVAANPYYVMNDNLRVYVCLEQAKNSIGATIPSTVKPTGVVSKPFTTSDGYVWQYLYQVGPGDANSFMTSNFIPVQHIATDDAAISAVEVEQKKLQDSAVSGAILGVEVLSQGSGYTGTVTFNFSEDGVGAAASANLSGGTITHVKLDSDNAGNILNGSGYRNSAVTVVGTGNGATVRAVLGPSAGVSEDPTKTLRCDALMFHSDFENTENNTILSENDFRQVALIKNPKEYNSVLNTDFTNQSGNAMQKLQFSSVTNNFLSDRVIVGQTSGAKAYLVHYDTVAWIYQNQTTGFTPFNAGETISAEEGVGSGSGTLLAVGGIVAPDVDIYSGDMIYINNIAAVTRDPNQTEDVKVVIKL